MTTDVITTFGGMALAVSLLTQFAKNLFKVNGMYVRLLAWVISLVIVVAFAWDGLMPQTIILYIVNSVIISLTAIGGYHATSETTTEISERKE